MSSAEVELSPASRRMDLRRIAIDGVLARVETALGVRRRTPPALIRKRRTLGFATDHGTWVRVECRGLEKLEGQGWGFEAAAALRGVPIPEWYAGVSWLDARRAVMWHADEVQLIDQSPIGRAANAQHLPPAWWESLNTALGALGRQPTRRIATPDGTPITAGLIDAAIRPIFPACTDLTIEQWATAHADLYWSNLTAPNLWLLDLEDWGRAPRGLDAASLWSASLATPDLARKVRAVLANDLESRTGKIMQLLKCAEVLAWADETEPLYAPARHEADLLARELECRI